MIGINLRHIVALAVCVGAAACDRQPSAPLPFEVEEGTANAVASNSWTTKRPMPTPRFFLKAATIDNTIYAIGGVAAVEAYNVATNSWSTKRPYPGANKLVNGASVINGKIYVTSGRNLYVYDPKTNAWARKADMPRLLAPAGLQAVIGGQLYVYGTCPSGCSSHWLLRYNPASNSWVFQNAPPSMHKHGAVGVINSKIFLAGGDNQNFRINRTTDVYFPSTNSWSSRAEVLDPRVRPASAALQGKLYVAGGADAGGAPDVERLAVFDPASNLWTEKASMSGPRTGAAGVEAAGQFFVIGGESNGVAAGTVEAYTP